MSPLQSFLVESTKAPRLVDNEEVSEQKKAHTNAVITNDKQSFPVTPPSFGPRSRKNAMITPPETFQSPLPGSSQYSVRTRQRKDVKPNRENIHSDTQKDGDDNLFQSPFSAAPVFDDSQQLSSIGSSNNKNISPLIGRPRRSGKRSIEDREDNIILEDERKSAKKRRASHTATLAIGLSPAGTVGTKQRGRKGVSKTLTSKQFSSESTEQDNSVVLTPNPEEEALLPTTTTQPSTVSPTTSTSPSSFTPFRFVTDKVFRPLLATFTSSSSCGDSEEAFPLQPPSASNPFVRDPCCPSENGKSLIHQHKPDSACNGVDLLQKLPNFLCSSNNNRMNKTDPSEYANLPDLISEEVGGRIIFATDEFFASAGNLLKPTEPQWKDTEFTEFGKWNDGWETRRRRERGHDWCLIELGIPGMIKGVEVDTCYFTGNHAPYFSIEAAHIPDLNTQIDETLKQIGTCPYRSNNIGICQPAEAIEAINRLLEAQTKENSQQWRDLIGMSQLQPGYPPTSKQYFAVPTDTNQSTDVQLPPTVITHVRFNLFPDGGVARLRLYGCGMKLLPEGEDLNLAAMINGALPILCSNKHFGDPRNLLLSTAPKNMGSGWETARNINRHPVVEQCPETGLIQNLTGEEWVIIRLADRCQLSRLEIDTKYFIGNYPESVEVKGTDLSQIDIEDLAGQKSKLLESDVSWKVLLPRTKLGANANHTYFLVNRPSRKSKNFISPQIDTLLNDIGPITHLMMTIYPDGGVARLRAFGRVNRCTMPSP